MKAFNIVATAALFSSTFSWAKNLEDRTEFGLDIDSNTDNDFMSEKFEKFEK